MSRSTINSTISFHSLFSLSLSLQFVSNHPREKKRPFASFFPTSLPSSSFSSCHLRPGRDDSCAIMTSYFAGRELWTLLLLGVPSSEDSTAKPEPRVHGRHTSRVRAQLLPYNYIAGGCVPSPLGREFYFRRVCSYSVKLCAQNNTRTILGLAMGKCEYDEDSPAVISDSLLFNYFLHMFVYFLKFYLC